MVGLDKVLDVQSLSCDDNAILQIYPKNLNYIFNGMQIGSPYGSINQQFYLWRDPKDGYYTIIPIHSLNNAKCIGLENVKGGVGTKVKQRNLSFTDSFKWQISSVGNGQYEFILKSNGLKLDVIGNNNAPNVHLQVNFGNGQSGQRFALEKCNNIKINDADILLHMSERAHIEGVCFSEKCKKIIKELLKNFNNLKHVNISSEVEKIEDGAFDGHDIFDIICSTKWLRKFKKDKFKLKNIGLLAEEQFSVQPAEEAKIIIRVINGQIFAAVVNSDGQPYDVKGAHIKREDFQEVSDSLEHLYIVMDDCKTKDDLLKKLKIDDGALDDFTKIESFDVRLKRKDDPKKYDIKFDLIDDIDFAYYLNLDRYMEIKVPDGINKIRAKRFKNKKYLSRVILPKSINEIEEGAFEGCESLREISLPEGVTEIPDRAFKGCKSLSKINLNKVDTINETAFEGCDSLYYDNVTSDNEQLRQMFDTIARVPSDRSLIDCKFIKKLCNSEVIEIEHDEANDILLEIDEEIKAKFIKCTPQSLKILSKIANFERIFISEGIQEIDKAAFENCKNVKQVVIPDSVTKIEQGTFDNCSNINFVKYPLRLLESFNRANLEYIVLDETEEEIENNINFDSFLVAKI